MTLEYRINPDERRGKIAESIRRNGFIRIIEAHNGLSALVGETACITHEGKKIGYDGFWESSFTDSASKGMPDVEIVSNDSRLHTIREIANVTSKPIIVDGDTGGSNVQFEYFVSQLDQAGVSAVIIEDKVFPKRNSLDASAKQTLEDPNVFVQKIIRGRSARLSEEFMVMARIESLIAGLGIDDAFMRAEKYIKAGADGIMIHARGDIPQPVLEFSLGYNHLCERFGHRPYLVCVPTTYNMITDEELSQYGFNIIIHANHLLRSSYKAMQNAAAAILSSDRGFEAEPLCASVPAVFSQVGFDRVKAKDREYTKSFNISAIIPAAGKDPVFSNKPKSLIKIRKKPILRYQLDSIRKAGISNVSVIKGYNAAMFDEYKDETNLSLIENDQYENKHSLHSLFCAENQMKDGFVLVYSDILFSENILRRLIAMDVDMAIVVDSSYRYHQHDVNKQLDLVMGRGQRTKHYRSLRSMKEVEITQIGKKINLAKADYEFIGMAYFSKEGASILRKVYHDCLDSVDGLFHESVSIDRAGVTDLLQEIIDRKFVVHGLEVSHEWMEIHSREDIEIAETETAFLVNYSGERQ